MRQKGLVYFDCFSGISGDMILGALLDCGLDVDWLRSALETGLPTVTSYRIAAESIVQQGIVGTRCTVSVTEGSTSQIRDWRAIRALLTSSHLAERPRALALRIFERLAAAEALVHGVPVEEVHFHEVGAVDSIVDVVGAALGLDRLGIETVYSSPLTDGRGFTRSQHGMIPVPVPATAALLAMVGAPSREAATQHELVTPTGAAIVTALAEFRRPEFEVTRVGYGFGRRELPWPNALRLWLGNAIDNGANADAEHDEMVVLETNIDDMNPQFYGPLLDRLFAAGAVDAFLTPVVMKKGRPGIVVTVLAPPGSVSACTELLLTETTSLGVRQRTESRVKARRSIEVVTTPWGAARVKLKKWGGRTIGVAPEFDDCQALSIASGTPFPSVHATVLRLGEQRLEQLRGIELEPDQSAPICGISSEQ